MDNVNTAQIKATAAFAKSQFKCIENLDGSTFFIPTQRRQDKGRMVPILEAADAGIIPPDKYRYHIICGLLDFLTTEVPGSLTLVEIQEAVDEWIERTVDVYNADLLHWVASHPGRQSLVDNAIYDVGSGYTLEAYMRRAQSVEIEGLVEQTLEALVVMSWRGGI